MSAVGRTRRAPSPPRNFHQLTSDVLITILKNPFKKFYALNVRRPER